MADVKTVEEKETLSKAAVKRKYLLTDEDLQDLQYEMKDNPLNKSYRMLRTAAIFL